MAGAITALVGALVCTFTTASIDGRAAFDSMAVAQAAPVPDAPGLAVLRLGDGPPRAAVIRREGVWLSLRTAPDPDHGGRVAILDLAQAGQHEGDAVLVISDPDAAARMVSRTGTCRTETAL